MSKGALKAYAITEECENTGGVVFARFHAEARRHGASEYGDGTWESVECRRAKEFDEYAPGPVPIEAYLSQGWYWTCTNCDGHVYASDRTVIMGRNCYCNRWCHLHHVERAGSRKAEEALAAVMCRLELPFNIPGEVRGYFTSNSVVGRGNVPCLGASFELPGLSYSVRWSSLEPHSCWVSAPDTEAFKRWKAQNAKSEASA